MASGAASNTASAPSLDTTSSPAMATGTSLSTAFSCGSHWTKAQTCSTLCPTGDDDACPPGQYCYGGTPCEGGEASMEEVLERQRHLEQREMNRLARQRDEEYVNRFVCGGSYVEAEESCAVSSSLTDGATTSSILDTATAPAATHYCPTGSSSQCPTGMECYAAVPCPRSTHDEEPPLLQEVSLRLLLNSFLVTEPILFNATTMGEDRNDSLVDEEWISLSEWSSLVRESSSSILGTVSALVSSHYGLN
eukprot:CAMPEP_0201881710 /NCGR_PEP_ID=MMETSP0902-20130614/11932_1 /ASSEMBLY_ACC=CAM_ASM_000551 /TAXON_ID=420261 /ORGANISM="Thalassiosira antarctica, Strain CCMP982" /LENGTH=249 /DNA_ID=CAMNT_0048409973 /DNA_START=290 /DNA_END=1039 /DNA_ORIENTATION=-